MLPQPEDGLVAARPDHARRRSLTPESSIGAFRALAWFFAPFTRLSAHRFRPAVHGGFLGMYFEPRLRGFSVFRLEPLSVRRLKPNSEKPRKRGSRKTSPANEPAVNGGPVTAARKAPLTELGEAPPSGDQLSDRHAELLFDKLNCVRLPVERCADVSRCEELW